MPILPPSTGLPYDSLNYILDGVRAKMGVDIDSLEALSGSVFSRTACLHESVVQRCMAGNAGLPLRNLDIHGFCLA